MQRVTIIQLVGGHKNLHVQLSHFEILVLFCVDMH